MFETLRKLSQATSGRNLPYMYMYDLLITKPYHETIETSQWLGVVQIHQTAAGTALILDLVKECWETANHFNILNHSSNLKNVGLIPIQVRPRYFFKAAQTWTENSVFINVGKRQINWFFFSFFFITSKHFLRWGCTLVGSLVSDRISSSSSLERKKNRGKYRRFFSR